MKTVSKVNLKQNVEFQLRDKTGKAKPLFQGNRLYNFLLKKGIISPHFKIPFLLGDYRLTMRNENLVVSAGMAGVASRINGAGAEAAFTYIALGEGTGAAAPTDATLEDEIATAGGERASATATRVQTTVANDTAQLVNTFSFTGTFAVTESGVLNAGAVGTLLARQVFAAINVQDGDSLQVTWKFAVATA